MIVSADDYFMKDGAYQFNAAHLPMAHLECFRRFVLRLQEGKVERVVILSGLPGAGKSSVAQRQNSPTTLVVDNTNLSAFEISPYVLAAQAFGWPAIEIMRVHCDPAVAYARQIHGVPAVAHERMAENFAKRDVMPWWCVREVNAETVFA